MLPEGLQCNSWAGVADPKFKEQVHAFSGTCNLAGSHTLGFVLGHAEAAKVKPVVHQA